MDTIKTLIFFFVLMGCPLIKAQEKEHLNTFSFEEVEKLHQENPKPIVVFIYANWCKICFGMKKTTFENDKIISILNKRFYFISFNGEEKKDITFLGKTFVYEPTGTKTGIHELANELASKNGIVSYPTTVFLNSKFEIELQLAAFISSKKMIRILTKI